MVLIMFLSCDGFGWSEAFRQLPAATKLRSFDDLIREKQE